MDTAPTYIVFYLSEMGSFNGIEIPHFSIVFLPPNTTSMYQPMDKGIIKCVKIKYKSHLVKWLLPAEYGRLPMGINLGIVIPIMENAFLWISEAWVSCTSTTIQNCWHHADIINQNVEDVSAILPRNCFEEVNSLYRAMGSHVEDLSGTFKLMNIDEILKIDIDVDTSIEKQLNDKDIVQMVC